MDYQEKANDFLRNKFLEFSKLDIKGDMVDDLYQLGRYDAFEEVSDFLYQLKEYDKE